MFHDREDLDVGEAMVAHMVDEMRGQLRGR